MLQLVASLRGYGESTSTFATTPFSVAPKIASGTFDSQRSRCTLRLGLGGMNAAPARLEDVYCVIRLATLRAGGESPGTGGGNALIRLERRRCGWLKESVGGHPPTNHKSRARLVLSRKVSYDQFRPTQLCEKPNFPRVMRDGYQIV